MSEQQQIRYFLERLEASGKRSTPQRHAVCQALIEHGGHPTVGEIYERVRGIFPMISQATVYNTVDTLEALGLLHRIEIANHEHTHYDLHTYPHVNLVCTHCSSITDVHIELLTNMLNQISQHTRYRIQHASGLVVYGTCPACQRAATGTAAVPADPPRNVTTLYPQTNSAYVHGNRNGNKNSTGTTETEQGTGRRRHRLQAGH